MIGLSIPLTDDGSECSSRYQVEYKKATDAGYTQAPDAFESPVEIYNLQENTDYVIRITRYCCNGNFSPPLIFNRTTGGSSLSAPENFTATPFVGPEISLEWDNDTDADNYVIDRALDAGFTSSVVERYNGPYLSSVLDTSGLLGATTYYYRIRAQKTGFPDSPYSYANATTP